MGTPHNEAKLGDFAKYVLMPGDPNRAKFIADHFLHDVVLVNSVRGVNGYTGYTSNGVRISVMASGMGMPSISIYATELFTKYDVEGIIRIGTCGAYREDIKLGDVILAQGACTDSAGKITYQLKGGVVSAIADYDLLSFAMDKGKTMGKKMHSGNILSSGLFYDFDPEGWKQWAHLGIMGVEMEAYALYLIAQAVRKKALAICTVTDSTVIKDILSPKERETGLLDMINLGIAVAEEFTNRQ